MDLKSNAPQPNDVPPQTPQPSDPVSKSTPTPVTPPVLPADKVSPTTTVASPPVSGVQPAPAADLQPSQPATPASAPIEVHVGVVEPAPSQPGTLQVGVIGPAPSVGTLAPTGPGNDSRASRFGFKKLLVPIVAAVVVLGSASAAYFGYYLPNTPEGIWHSALVNSGKGYDKLSQYATVNKHAKGWGETGSFKFTGPFVADGTLSGKSDGQTGDFSGSLSATGLKLGVDVRSFPSTGDTPDIYFKLDGLQGLGSLIGGLGADPAISSALNGLNGQWYVVDHTFFEQFAQGANTNIQITSSDVSSALDAIGKASKQYIFTADDKKAVVVVKQRLGKEKQDNRSVYHYKVGVNKQNLKAYLSALCANLKSSKLSKLLNTAASGSGGLDCTSMQQAANNLDENATADAWVDTHTKLIHDVRFYDKTNHNDYFDIGQDYQGGSSFPFIFATHSKSGDTTSDFGMKITLDTVTNTIKLSGQFKASGTDSENGTVNVTIAPNNQPVKVDKPANAKTIIQLLNDLGVGSLSNDSTDTTGATTNFAYTSSRARDSKRASDINSLQTQVEAFFAQYGYYPSLKDLNSAAWRGQYMKSLDANALQDPQGSGAILAAAPAAKVYAYQPRGSSGGSCEANDQACAAYTLTATLETGGTYSKVNLD